MTEIFVPNNKQVVDVVLKQWKKSCKEPGSAMDKTAEACGVPADQVFAITMAKQEGLKPKEIAQRLDQLQPGQDAANILNDLI